MKRCKKKNDIVLLLCFIGISTLMDAQKTLQSLPKTLKPKACKELAEHQEKKPKPGEPEIAVYPSPSMLWSLKNEELYEQCKVETTEETVKRLKEQLKKDKARWVQSK